jgi:hypothetical protein
LREVVLEHNVGHADAPPGSDAGARIKENPQSLVSAYATTSYATINAVVYDFSPSRAGEHARAFLQD